MDKQTKRYINVRDAISRIQNNGGKVKQVSRIIEPPSKPGLKVLSAMDCLVNYASYRIVKR
jgi:hypothetical protein